jgi:hypothetical protein
MVAASNYWGKSLTCCSFGRGENMENNEEERGGNKSIGE